jgi:hypothetical protein
MSDAGVAVHDEEDQVAEPTPENAAEEPLPPIPDGGLATAMPVWLQQAPGRPVSGAAPETVDIASLAKSLELPPWLSALAERLDAGQHREPAETPVEPAAVLETPASEPVDAEPAAALAADIVAEDAPSEDAPEPEIPASAGRPLGAAVLAAQQNAAERGTRPGKLQLPPIPAAAPVDAEEFLRGGEIAITPEPRSRMPFIVAAVLIVVLAAAAVWYFGA